MWTPIRALIVEDEPLAAQYLATLLDETCRVQVVGVAHDAETALALGVERRPDVAFLDVRLPGRDGVSLASQLAMLPQAPQLVFTTGQPDRATDAFRLAAVDYLLKPLDPAQVEEAVARLSERLGLFQPEPAVPDPGDKPGGDVPGREDRLLPVKDADRDQVQLLERREVVAALRRDRRTWVHTVRQEFATYYPLADLLNWLGGEPFVQVGRHAVVNLRAVEQVTHYGDRLYRLRLRDRAGTEVSVSRSGAGRLAALLKGL